MSTPRPGEPVRGSKSGRPIMALLDLLGRRWSLRILWEMRHGDAMTFRALQSACDDVSPTSLNRRLKELRDVQLVALAEDGYYLTTLGLELLEALSPLNDWSRRWASLQEA